MGMDTDGLHLVKMKFWFSFREIFIENLWRIHDFWFERSWSFDFYFWQLKFLYFLDTVYWHRLEDRWPDCNIQTQTDRS